MSSYHFPNERRRVERRVAPAGAYAGPDRRRAGRRQGDHGEGARLRNREPMNRALLWAAVVMVLILADSEFLGGAYWTMIVDTLTSVLAHIRSASDNIWGWRR